MTLRLIVILLLHLVVCTMSRSQSLRIATVNVWSGIDYDLGWSVGEYETEEVRERRFQILVQELKSRSVDVIAIQEVNPTCPYSRKLAEALGFDEIHQIANAGIKVFRLGIPTNMKEGIAILAHPRLNLKYHEVFKVSGSFGFYGDVFSLHFDEATFVLIGKIVVDNIPLYIANVHLQAAPPETMKDTLTMWREMGKIDETEFTHVDEQLTNKAKLRGESFRNFLDCFREKYHDKPVVLSGDFNAEPRYPEISTVRDSLQFLDVYSILQEEDGTTWSFSRNPNVAFSVADTFVSGKPKSGLDLLSAAYDKVDRRIDYIFLNPMFDSSAVSYVEVFLDSTLEGVFASDHFGLLAEIDLAGVGKKVRPEYSHFTPITTSSIEGFPILTYDTDVGFGYGAKGFFLNTLGWNESFDVTLFNSVHIERWYRLVFSIPDFEQRQGKTYPFAVDLIVDFDKYLQANLFPPGNTSDPKRKETYTREPLEISLITSRGFRQTFVGQSGIRFKTVNNFGFSDASIARRLVPEPNVGRNSMLSLLGNIRVDTRDSYINPQRGFMLQGEMEVASASVVSDFNLFRATVTGQYFSVLFYPTTVFASRLVVQHVFGGTLPFWAMSTLGGNNTLRGYPIDRFVDNGMLLINTELRFPIYWRLRGVLFFDAGRVWHTLREFTVRSFHSNPGVGLRFVMDTFVVRLDVGFSSETTGLYFNFGHAF